MRFGGKTHNKTGSVEKGTAGALGFSLVDVIVGTALISIVFLGVFGLFRLGTKVVGQSRAKITAAAVANDYMEKIRSLPYESVGIAGGFPDGLLESSTTTVMNNIIYTITTRVDYVVDETDGLVSPEDDCPNDYKKVEVTVSWSGGYGGELSLVSNFTPETLSQECADEGGILSISVFDAYGLMVPAPLIEIRNPATDELIKSAVPDNGSHYFSLNSSTSYKVVVSKPGFSTERTYGIDEITDPNKSHPWVLENKLTEYFFSIDETSSFFVQTSSPWGEDYFYDSFADTSKISSSNNVAVGAGEVALEKNPGVYFTDGTNDIDLCSFPGNSGDCAQSFTTGSQAKQISSFQLFLKKATTSPSDIYAEIREGSATGTVLGTSSQITGSTLPINFEWVEFSLPAPVNLSANTQYFLRLRSVPDSAEDEGQGPILWGHLTSTSSPPGYAGGNAFRYVGKNEEAMGDYDFSFKIYDDEYTSSGDTLSIPIAPANLNSWNQFSWTDEEPLSTDLKYHFYYASDTDWLLIPEVDLPGNQVGFDLSPADLSGIDAGLYPQLKVGAELSTGDVSVSPTLYDWQISWITTSATPIPNVSFVLRGNKTIGSDSDENPVYKYYATSTSGGDGTITLNNMEWDLYDFSIPISEGLDLTGTDPSPQPINLAPDGITQNVTLYLEANNSLLLTVRNDETLEPVFAASVRLYNSGLGYDVTQNTDIKGQTYFIPLDIATYDVEITAVGYSSTSTSISVSGDKAQTIRMEQIE